LGRLKLRSSESEDTRLGGGNHAVGPRIPVPLLTTKELLVFRLGDPGFLQRLQDPHRVQRHLSPGLLDGVHIVGVLDPNQDVAC